MRTTIIFDRADFRTPPDYHLDMWQAVCAHFGLDPDETESIEIEAQLLEAHSK